MAANGVESPLTAIFIYMRQILYMRQTLYMR